MKKNKAYRMQKSNLSKPRDRLINTIFHFTMKKEKGIFINNEHFGLGRFATDLCYAPHVNGRYAALLLTKPLII